MKFSSLLKYLLISLLCMGSSLWAVKEKIKEVEDSVKEARVQFIRDPLGAVSTFKALSKKFDAIEGEEQEWESCLEERKIFKWSHQTAKQALGSDLFYPTVVEELLDSIHTAPLVRRNDNIWLLTLAAKYGDPRGQYYLSYILSEIIKDHDHMLEIPHFVQDLYHAAREKFIVVVERNGLNPQALYFLACDEAFKEARSGHFSSQGIEKAEKYFNKILENELEANGEAKRGMLQFLRMKSKYAKGYYSRKTPPNVTSYEKAGRDYSFGPAFEEASTLCKKDRERSRKLLEEAISNNYFPAYISLGIWFHEGKDDVNAEKHFLLAAEHGVTQGLIMAGILKVGDASAKSFNKLYPGLSAIEIGQEEGVKKALQFFKMAGKTGNPQGWDKYVAIYESLLHIVKQENKMDEVHESKLSKIIKKGIGKGLSLGDEDAYSRLEDYTNSLFTPKEAKRLIEKYGKPPYDNLWEDIKDFIEEKSL